MSQKTEKAKRKARREIEKAIKELTVAVPPGAQKMLREMRAQQDAAFKQQVHAVLLGAGIGEAGDGRWEISPDFSRAICVKPDEVAPEVKADDSK
jgi:hypothetical protein